MEDEEEIDPVEEYLRPGRRRRAVAATLTGILGLSTAVAGIGWSRLEVPPSAPPLEAPVPVSVVPEPPPPPAPVSAPAPKARPRPRPPAPVLATTDPPVERKPAERRRPEREAPPTATLRPKPAPAD